MRRRLDVAQESFHPAYAVWELTLRCDHACRHCGSRARDARPDELTTEEALDVARQLAELGAREVVLIGGEAYLHDGFLAVARALADAGVRVGITTSGLGITDALAAAMAAAGVRQASVSVDGLEASHDRLRARPGSHAAALAALARLRGAGLTVTANTQVNRLDLHELEALYPTLRDAGIVGWQVQLTVPLGRAADRPDLVLQPYDLLALIPRLAALKRAAHEDGVLLMPGNNVGYFGPEEAELRATAAGEADRWAGCQAGRFVLGIESHGDVKGCPSLQSAAYVGGNLRERSLASIWRDSPELSFTRARGVDDLWGFCRTCPYAEGCLGGCSFTAHAVLGRPGNQPYCYFRARRMRDRGRRERLVPTAPAPGRPFDHGLFAIVEEPLDAPEPDAPLGPDELVRIRRRPSSGRDTQAG